VSKDINSILEGWEFEPNQVIVRRIKGDDGRDKIQLRLDMGMLQMEFNGRPDGKTPFGKESLLDHYQSLLQRHVEKNGSEDGFTLDENDCTKLQQEAVQYYHRYLACFHLGEYDVVIRDTQRNIALLDFVAKYAVKDELAMVFQQFRPYILMMNTRSKANRALERKDFSAAIDNITRGIEKIKDFLAQTQSEDMIEGSTELKFLSTWLDEVKLHQPLTPREKIQKDLAKAIEKEDYEMAARLRDALFSMDKINKLL